MVYFRALADTDSDGKMNINEFSIACKLINLKLRQFEIPKTLPPILIASLSAVGGTPTLTPSGIGSLSPLDPLKSLTNSVNTMPPSRPPMPAQPAILQQQQMRPQPFASVPPQPHSGMPVMSSVMASQPLIPGMGMMQPAAGPPPIIPMSQPLIPGVQSMQPLIPGGLSYIPQTQQPLMQQHAVMSNTSAIPPGMGSLDLLGNKLPSPVDLIGGVGIPGVAASLPAPPTPPQSGTPSRNMSISEKAPSIESPSSAMEWAIKSQSKLKYTQLFNTTDRSRSGFLTGAQARNLMVQTKLPQSVLAQIWALSDMDSDGRLGCEEFVLAMYLCEMSSLGDTIPSKLPPELIPPSFRKGLSRHGSTVGSRHGSVSSQGTPATESDPSAGLPNQSKY